MKTKEEIRHYLDIQFSPSEDDMVSIVRNDFDRILNSAASCALITVEGAMPLLAEQLRTELEALHIEGDLDVIVKVSYHPTSEISFDDLCSLLTVIHEFAPQVNIVWGCGTDAKLAETDYSILLLIGISSGQKILRRDYSSYSHEPDKIHYPPVRSDCIGPNTATTQQPNT